MQGKYSPYSVSALTYIHEGLYSIHFQASSAFSTKSAKARICRSFGTYTPPFLKAREAMLFCVNSHTSQSCLFTISNSSTASIGLKPGCAATSRSEEHTSE